MKRKRELTGLSTSRFPMERMMRIHRAIQSGAYPNASTLAAELQVSTKSIHRDLDFMRDRLELPLEYDDSRFGYYYTEEVADFPSLQISEGELFALVVAEKALQQYRGTHFEKPLVSALRKMAAALPDTISVNWQEWDQTISFRTSAEPILNLETIDALSRAVSRCQQLKLLYRKPGARHPETRLVDPYHLANINGEWFLFAYCHLRKDIRTFVPMRMLKLEPTGKTFERPKKFSLEARLRDSFGVHTGQGEYHVAIRFNALVADYIREKKWHPSQKLRELADGGVELSLTLSSLVEIRRWILGWGGAARVVEPQELAASVREAAQAILNQAVLPARTGR